MQASGAAADAGSRGCAMTRSQALAAAEDHWCATAGNRKGLDRFAIWVALFRAAGAPV